MHKQWQEISRDYSQLGGGIQKGVNSIKAIDELAKTSPKVANAISSFISGTTYGGLREGARLARGEVKPSAAVANSLHQVWFGRHSRKLVQGIG